MKEVEALWEEVRELSLGNSTYVERLDSPPTPLQFQRDFVSPNKPCIVSHAIDDWPALALWSSDDYLCRALSSTEVSVHLTPDGRADSLVPHPNDPSALCFASAHLQRMPFSDALSLIDKHDKAYNFVAYAQQQNDCFRTEYGSLASDCEGHIDWATEALGCYPEAVNMWIGNNLSETSFHKDHYENLYAVVSGEKHFLLLPPTDVHRLYIRPYPAAQYSYHKDTGFSLEIEDPARFVPWCSVDPFPCPETKETEMSNFPLYFNGPKPFECTVKSGEMLYLPSMWFHYVRQSTGSSGRTIAVNYWYDMQFDIRYAYFTFLQSIRLAPRPYSFLRDDSSEDMSLVASVNTSRYETSIDIDEVEGNGSGGD
ncbi:hypothetical protein Droror1_Dr00007137 [Drosera rotundifolia]